MRRLGLHIVVALMCFACGLLAAASRGFIAPRWGTGLNAPDTYGAALPLRPETDGRMLPASPIRRVDFLNFTYPNDKGQFHPSFAMRPSFRLDDGHLGYLHPFVWVRLSDVVYADLTGDGEEEAVVELLSGHGFGEDHSLYVYTMWRGEPMFLSFFHSHRTEAGYGGFRDVYAEGGDLVIELYGRNVMKAPPSSFDYGETCDDCSLDFTRFRYHWDGKRFRQKGKEVLPLASKQD